MVTSHVQFIIQQYTIGIVEHATIRAKKRELCAEERKDRLKKGPEEFSAVKNDDTAADEVDDA